MIKERLTTEKSKGRVYTPDFIVNNILDLSDYYGNNIIQKHVIDNSCGDGAFLIKIVERYCEASVSLGNSTTQIGKELSKYIHGIDIDKNECDKCIKNLNAVAEKYNIFNIQWDICCDNTLTVSKYDGKMDFVLGNPPYIRVHNLKENFNVVKKFTFAQNGMVDLYIVFYEIGLRMLNSNGVLGYITPSSFFSSIAGKTMREYFINNDILDKVVDLKHYQAFKSTTYTAISILKKSRKKRDVDYYEFDEKIKRPFLVDTLTFDDFYISGKFYFADKNRLNELKQILFFKCKKKYVEVKNGFATLADDFFIGDFDFPKFVIPVIKASTGKWTKCLFPYEDNKLIPFERLTENSDIKQYYDNNEELLKKRSLEKSSSWYGFGRTQGINDVFRLKYAINSLLRNTEDIKLNLCDKGCGVYSGLYILTDMSVRELEIILKSDDFIAYISMLGKYKSGGYYTFSSKDLELYLNYKYSQKRFDNE